MFILYILKGNGCDPFLHQLLDSADVFIQNLAPGAVNRLGFAFDTLQARYPELVMCDISGYGDRGEYSNMKAYDLLVQCESGMASITGTPDAPGRIGVSACDINCGQQAYAAILEAANKTVYCLGVQAEQLGFQKPISSHPLFLPPWGMDGSNALSGRSPRFHQSQTTIPFSSAPGPGLSCRNRTSQTTQPLHPQSIQLLRE